MRFIDILTIIVIGLVLITYIIGEDKIWKMERKINDKLTRR